MWLLWGNLGSKRIKYSIYLHLKWSLFCTVERKIKQDMIMVRILYDRIIVNCFWYGMKTSIEKKGNKHKYVGEIESRFLCFISTVFTASKHDFYFISQILIYFLKICNTYILVLRNITYGYSRWDLFFGMFLTC